jgi:hypothetical protein
MKIEADKVTNILGIVGAVLIMQQTYFPELIPKEHAAPILAGIMSTFGIASNKRKITIWFNGTNNVTNEQDKISELEAEIDRKWQEIEELIEETREICRLCRAKNKGGKSE